MSVSYFVRYEGRAESPEAFLRHYREHHAPILAGFPGVERIVLHTPVEWRDPFPVKPDRFALLAQMVFASPQDLDRALQSEDGPQQHRLAGAGAADDAEHLIGAHLHVEPVVHHLGPEAVHQPLHLQHRVQLQMSISMNSTANRASASITQKIACTTATVTRRPSSRADPRTCMPR